MPYQYHLQAFLYAVQFLTRVPVTLAEAPSEQDQARAALYYPLVGLLIGCLLALLAALLPTDKAILAAVVLLLAWSLLTGALHLDGLADSADAWLGGSGDTNKTHRILKDPLVGTAGVVAVGIILLLKYSALTILIKQQDYGVILLAPVLGRSLVLLLFVTTPYVHQQGLAAAVTRRLNAEAAILGLVPVAILAAWLSPIGLLFTAVIFLALRRIMIRRIGGCTGDTAGATLEAGEAFWLLGAALY